MELELVSFELCPFVQRCSIALEAAGVEHKVSRVDVDDPPAWFPEVSPLGLVPVLRVSDGETEEVIFESAVINEFIDELTGGALTPNDPVTRALSRSWTEFASAVTLDLVEVQRAASRDALEAAVATVRDRLDRMEARFGEGPFWNGADLHLVDAAMAPLLLRVRALEPLGVSLLDDARTPKLVDYADALLTTPEVVASIPEDFEARFAARVRGRNGYLVTGDDLVTVS